MVMFTATYSNINEFNSPITADILALIVLNAIIDNIYFFLYNDNY